MVQVARIINAEGASFIYRENSRRYVLVRFAVRDRDLQSAIQDSKDQLWNIEIATANLAVDGSTG